MKSKTRNFTLWVMVFSTVGLVLYDIYAESKDNNETISVIIHNSAKKNPIIAFAIGLLSGHWFWSQK